MENKLEVWHNNRCSKSRGACQWLSEQKLEVTIVDYINEPISKSDLSSVLKKLGIPAFDLIRKKEKMFLENWKGLEKSEEEWIQIMIENPRLIERPIVVKGDKAVIARPLENVENLFLD